MVKVENTDGSVEYKQGECIWDKVSDPQFVLLCANLFGNYQNGFLLCAGGLVDQPHWYIQMIGLMSSNKNRIEEERRQASEKAQRAKQR